MISQTRSDNNSSCSEFALWPLRLEALSLRWGLPRIAISVEAPGFLRWAGERLAVQSESVAARHWTLLVATSESRPGLARWKLRCLILAHHNPALSYCALQAVLRCGAGRSPTDL